MNDEPKIRTNLESRTEVFIIDNNLIEVTEEAIFELLRDIKDPEHSFSIEQLDVIKREYVEISTIKYYGVGIDVGYPLKYIRVIFKPTIPHCSMAGIIGLSIKLVLQRFIKGYEIQVTVLKDSHVNWEMISKQLNDKDRVLAASENSSLMSVIRECTAPVVNKYCH
ncbi:MIP18 family protein F45G2.10 [Nosema granulosis]|uniref:MIP18 family protein F45G2.10 n=1 Tax=Nosema granulosis TaxID=83296 RepID=A0A9P6KZY6_9MICR|nr:MIP18 family protein F45G2.10 [Nosema granulosis]